MKQIKSAPSGIVNWLGVAKKKSKSKGVSKEKTRDKKKKNGTLASPRDSLQGEGEGWEVAGGSNSSTVDNEERMRLITEPEDDRELCDFPNLGALLDDLRDINRQARRLDNIEELSFLVKQLKAAAQLEVGTAPLAVQKQVQTEMVTLLKEFKALQREAGQKMAHDAVLAAMATPETHLEEEKKRRGRKSVSNEQAVNNEGPEIAAMVAAGDKAQDRTEAAIARMERALVDTEQNADVTAAMVEAQVAQMEGVLANYDQLDEALKQGRSRARALMRGVFKDKCFIILLITAVLLLAACLGIELGVKDS